ncbi:hypothetical protein LOD99_941 [Oopsacas minuta]|uniref:Uncharacterized protein n=1 Tax=Oopsacas minuta TaxID=111878 RepID=A0AAV7K1A2_9METZ|nr:hypothetical protein LOD99_941 [Oopsacas minuta]
MNSAVLLCFIVLLAITNAQFPQLSGSFSFQGSSESTTFGLVTSNPCYNVYNDISRGLQSVVSTQRILFTTPTTVQVASVNDSAEYSNTVDTCVRTIADSLSISPFSVNESTWDIFQRATESPAGTFTVSNIFNTHQVVIVDGLPTEYTETATFQPP